MDYSSSSTNTITDGEKYDVFISFRDEDTRYGFSGHLFRALHERQIKTLFDKQLVRGEEISEGLWTAIGEPKISVIIFSENYASSKWCMRELAEIMKYREMKNQIVIPVFYKIDPSHVQKQTGRYEAAFAKHENELQQEEVKKWRDALTRASNISGFDSYKAGSESVLIQTIVNDICNRLNYMLPEDTHFVDIREDVVAIQVPKNTVERMFVASNLILEVPSAVFDQLSSVHKPQYVLVIMLMSLTAMLICIIELAYKGGEARVGWRWGKKKIPWFYHPSPSDKPFGTVTDFIGLLCSFFQCIFSVSHYVFYLRNINDPINISIWPLVFAFCLLCSTFSKKSPKKEALL